MAKRGLWTHGSDHRGLDHDVDCGCSIWTGGLLGWLPGLPRPSFSRKSCGGFAIHPASPSKRQPESWGRSPRTWSRGRMAKLDLPCLNSASLLRHSDDRSAIFFTPPRFRSHLFRTTFVASRESTRDRIPRRSGTRSVWRIAVGRLHLIWWRTWVSARRRLISTAQSPWETTRRNWRTGCVDELASSSATRGPGANRARPLACGAARSRVSVCLSSRQRPSIYRRCLVSLSPIRNCR